MKENPRNKILQEIKVSENALLLPFLIDNKVRKSRNAVKSLLVHKQVKVNGRITTLHNHELKKGDKVTIHPHDKKLDQKKLKGLTIIYEDKYLLVVDKESGLLSVSTGKEQLKETAFNIVNHYIKNKNAKERAYILFRLDRENSGLIVFAKSEEVQQELQDKWALHPPKRSFQAIVEGKMTPPNGTITTWLTENKNFLVFSSPTDNGGLKAVSHYKTIQANSKYSLLKIELESSRKNQIRVQLQSTGHPIIGDKKYGSKISPIRRLALHADEVVFTHPVTNELLELKSPLPKKMQIIADSILLKKDAKDGHIQDDKGNG